MTKPKQQIIDEIKDHFTNIPYKQCYVGITSEVESRLFKDHNVSQNNGHWIKINAENHSIAREIERHFINTGMDGGDGGGDASSTTVYAYKKESQTNP